MKYLLCQELKFSDRLVKYLKHLLLFYFNDNEEINSFTLTCCVWIFYLI
jgi:hypothetical protein